jgi:hypothetical protein
MRFIGISLIILAHVNLPAWLWQIGSFEVVLMVVTSALAFAQFPKLESYKTYLVKRTKRLVFPMWLFLSFYFFLEFVLVQLGIAEPPTLRVILGSYFLLDGIGFVWIIRVFFLVSLAGPFIIKLDRKIRSNYVYLLIWLVLYLIYELLLFLTLPQNLFFEKILSEFVYYGIGFTLVWSLGIRIPHLSKKQCCLLAAIFLSIFVALTISYSVKSGTIVYISLLKFPPIYPPSINYLSYGMGMSMLVYLTVDKALKNLSIIDNLERMKHLILFISQNTMWVYLWHIPLVRMFGMIKEKQHFLIEYFVVYSVAVMIAFIQVSFVNKILFSAIKKDSLKKNLKIILTG